MSPITGKNLIKDGQQRDQRVTNMLGVLPSSTTDSNSATTRSSLGIGSLVFDTDVSISLSVSDEYQFHNTSNHFLDLNSQYFEKEVGAQGTSSKSFLNRKFQHGYKTSGSNTGKLPHRFLANPLYEKPNSFGGLSKNQCGEMGHPVCYFFEEVIFFLNDFIERLKSLIQRRQLIVSLENRHQ